MNKLPGRLVFLRLILQPGKYSTRSTSHAANYESGVPLPELDIEYLCNDKNKHEIKSNIKARKGVGDINLVHELYNYVQIARKSGTTVELNRTLKEFNVAAIKIPNKSCNISTATGETPNVVNVVGTPREFEFKPKELSEITNDLNMLRTENLGNFSGHRSYYLLGELAELEQALVQYSVQRLIRNNFKLLSVPDILSSGIIESCGMSTEGERTQVYKLDPRHYGNDLCLSGTSEMAIAGYLMNRVISYKDLPLKLAAVSRCYRAETSSLAEEKGIFRVHQFTKVEMFGVTCRNTSAQLLEEFRTIQEKGFESLGLHFKTLDMPPHELGAPAYRKYDVEAWLPGRQMYGEVSSCSDCTDYQSRRLNIKYSEKDSETLNHAHTINGTACAIPRMLIALLETHQLDNGDVAIPELLQPFMQGKSVISRQSAVPVMKAMPGKNRKPKK